jgi:hypothetical protein
MASGWYTTGKVSGRFVLESDCVELGGTHLDGDNGAHSVVTYRKADADKSRFVWALEWR